MIKKHLIHFIFYLKETLQRSFLLPYRFILNYSFYFKLVLFVYFKKNYFLKKRLSFLTLNMFLQSVCLKKINFLFFYLNKKIVFLLMAFNYNLYFLSKHSLRALNTTTTMLSLIRSPFVYKVSFEQLGVTTTLYNFFFKKIGLTLLSYCFFKTILFKFDYNLYSLFKCKLLLS
jgi:hypothetical protein